MSKKRKGFENILTRDVTILVNGRVVARAVTGDHVILSEPVEVPRPARDPDAWDALLDLGMHFGVVTLHYDHRVGKWNLAAPSFRFHHGDTLYSTIVGAAKLNGLIPTTETTT